MRNLVQKMVSVEEYVGDFGQVYHLLEEDAREGEARRKLDQIGKKSG